MSYHVDLEHDGRPLTATATRAGDTITVTVAPGRPPITVVTADPTGRRAGLSLVVTTPRGRVRALVVNPAPGHTIVGLPGWTLHLVGRRRADREATGLAGVGRLGPVASPITGRLVKLHVRQGEVVAAGQALAVVEAMKMENEIRAPAAGRVVAVRGQAGQPIEMGDVICELGPEEGPPEAPGPSAEVDRGPDRG